MNVQEFREARISSTDRKVTSVPQTNIAVWDAMRRAAAPEHVAKDIGVGISDQIECSCGWKSRGYWDMMEAAWNGWREHVAEVMGLAAKICPCGKTYIPADGGAACHELRSIF